MKKKLVLNVLLVLGVIIGGYASLISWLLGFLTAKLLGAKKEGQPSRVKSIVIPLGIRRLHLHHWFICLAFGLWGLAEGVYLLSPAITGGFLGGLAYQGIYCYKDWHRFVVKPGSDAVFLPNVNQGETATALTVELKPDEPDKS